jgi:hypothetical protein
LVRTLGPVSKSILARAAGLSPVTVVEIIGELTSEGLVREAGEGPSTGGKSPVLVELVPQARSAIGLDIGPQHHRSGDRPHRFGKGACEEAFGDVRRLGRKDPVEGGAR